jgi:1,4-dihydroxy-6-naphthoate synthase
LGARCTIAGIHILNQLALAREVDLCKVSAALLEELSSDYYLLPVGAGLGYGYGPKLVANFPATIADVLALPIVSPGRQTMAHRLLSELLEPGVVRELPFDQIIPALVEKRFHAGLVINESRFTLAAHGLYEIADLGALWQKKTQLPLPLGALVAKRSLGDEILAEICTHIQASLSFARKFPAEVMPFIVEKSGEKESEVLRQHIELYVTDDTFFLGQEAKKAFELIVPGCKEQLFHPKIKPGGSFSPNNCSPLP